MAKVGNSQWGRKAMTCLSSYHNGLVSCFVVLPWHLVVVYLLTEWPVCSGQSLQICLFCIQMNYSNMSKFNYVHYIFFTVYAFLQKINKYIYSYNMSKFGWARLPDATPTIEEGDIAWCKMAWQLCKQRCRVWFLATLGSFHSFVCLKIRYEEMAMTFAW